VASAAVCTDIFEAFDVASYFALEVTLEFEDLDHAAECCLFICRKFVGLFSWVNLCLEAKSLTKRDANAVERRKCEGSLLLGMLIPEIRIYKKIILGAAYGVGWYR
jgi:hypothetical protein